MEGVRAVGAALQPWSVAVASVLVASQRVLPKAAESTGYRFEFPDLGGALRDLSS